MKNSFLELMGVSGAFKGIGKLTNSFQVSSFKLFSFCSLANISMLRTTLQTHIDHAQNLNCLYVILWEVGGNRDA